jgi:dihydroxyacid dehydratase/phosphogluconate dehydratase
MLHLRRLGLLDRAALTVEGRTWDETLDEWEDSERRARLRARLTEADGVDPDDVICPPARARAKGMTSTVCFPVGNLAPGGSVVKSTAIDRSALDEDGAYRLTGRARVFTSERAAIAAIKGLSGAPIVPGDVIVLAGRGPLGSGMEETYQLTSALKFLPFGGRVALVTDARFSGVSTGPCIGHVSPEALEGGPIGKVRDGDLLRVVVEPSVLRASIDLVGHGDEEWGPEEGERVLAARPTDPQIAPDPELPGDTAIWARLQSVGGGLWGGCVYDVDAITRVIDAGVAALEGESRAGGG